MELVENERNNNGKAKQPSRIAIDSQSVKQTSFTTKDIGVDGGKKVKGRKRHIAVDSLGLPVGISVTAANVYDGKAGVNLLDKLLGRIKKNALFCVDNSYRGDFVKEVADLSYRVDVGQPPPSERGFVPRKGRWQVERSFGWLNFCRRLSKDYEKTVESALAFIQIAFINIILNRTG